MFWLGVILIPKGGAAGPPEDINNTKRIDAVVLNGRYFSKDSLGKMLADVEAAAGKR